MATTELFFRRGLKLSQLRLLTLFARVGQIRLVAEQLNVTQPAVSKQLADLEAGLGVPLLTRVGNRLQFTVVGEALLKHAREVFLQLEQARREVDALSAGLSGSVAIGAVATVMPVIAPELTLRIKQQAPNVRIAYVEATSDRLFPMLANAELDIVFSRMRPTGASPGLTAERVLDDPVVIVCGEQHPLVSRRRLVAGDLAGMPWILPPPDAPTRTALEAWLRQHGLGIPDGCVESIDLTANQAMFIRYPFLGLMPRSVSRPPLHVLRVPGASFLGTVWLAHDRMRTRPVVELTLQCIKALRQALLDARGL